MTILVSTTKGGYLVQVGRRVQVVKTVAEVIRLLTLAFGPSRRSIDGPLLVGPTMPST